MFQTNQHFQFDYKRHRQRYYYNNEKENECPKSSNINNNNSINKENIKRKSIKGPSSCCLTPLSATATASASASASATPLPLSLTSPHSQHYNCSSVPFQTFVNFKSQRRHGSNLTATTGIITEEDSSSSRMDSNSHHHRHLSNHHHHHRHLDIHDDSDSFDVSEVESVQFDDDVESVHSSDYDAFDEDEDEDDKNNNQSTSRLQVSRNNDLITSSSNSHYLSAAENNDDDENNNYDDYYAQSTDNRRPIHDDNSYDDHHHPKFLHSEEIENESFTTAKSFHHLESDSYNETHWYGRGKNYNYYHQPLPSSLKLRQCSLDIPSHIISSAQFNKEDEHTGSSSSRCSSSSRSSSRSRLSPHFRVLQSSSTMSSLSSMQWKHHLHTMSPHTCTQQEEQEWMPRIHVQQKNDFAAVTHRNPNHSFIPLDKPWQQHWQTQQPQQWQRQWQQQWQPPQQKHQLQRKSPLNFSSRQESLDIPSKLLSSVKFDDDLGYVENSSPSPVKHHNSAENIIQRQEQNRTSSIDEETNSFFAAIKRFFSIHNNKQRNMLTMTPLPKEAEPKKNFCGFPTNMCREPAESPITPEYERNCKQYLLQSTKTITSPNYHHHHHLHGGGIEDIISGNRNGNQESMETVKKQLGMKPIPNPALAKTIKKRNTSISVTESFVIVDETRPKSNAINVYEANSKTKHLMKNKECFYSGFDGKQNHYTYVSPPTKKKNNDNNNVLLPAELNNVITNHGNPTQIFASPTPRNSGKKLSFHSPELENATTVIHVVSPKKVNDERTRIEQDYENIKSGKSFDTASNSMESGERRIVDGFLQNANNASNWIHQHNEKPSISKKHIAPAGEPRVNDKITSFRTTHHDSYLRNNADIDDQTVQTYGTMCTNGTMHRRTNSTSTFTANSLARIFDIRSPLQQRRCRLNISPTFEVVPQTISKVSHYKRYNSDDDEESLISPLGDDVDDVSAFSFDQSLARDVLNGWSDHVKVVKKVVLPPEPEGVYMPKSNMFKDDITGRDEQSCLEGWLAFSKGSRLLETLETDGENISRKDLRYVVIKDNLLHVYTSKKNKNDVDSSLLDADLSMSISMNMSMDDSNNNNGSSSNHTATNTSTSTKHGSYKVLNLSRNMKVETKFISKRHGHCVCVIDKKTSKVVCTLLPVRLNPSFFRDDEYSQVIGSKKFKKIRDNLIGVIDSRSSSSSSSSSSSYTRKSITKASDHDNEGNNDDSLIYTSFGSQIHDRGNKGNSEWPMSMPQIAPEAQNTSVICLQFALDNAINLGHS